MKSRSSITRIVVGRAMCTVAGLAIIAIFAPHVFAQSSGTAAPAATKPAAAIDDPFAVTPPPAKTPSATTPDSSMKAPAGKIIDDLPFPADVTPKSGNNTTTPPATSSKTPTKPFPFGDDADQGNPAPGNLVPLPRSGAAQSPAGQSPAATPAPETPVPLTANPKPLSNEPTDLKSTETEMTPGQAEFNQGQDLAAAGKYAAAIEAYKKSLKLAKNDATTYQALGIAYRMLDRYDDAIVAFTESIRLQPESAEPRLRRGICWFQKNEYGLAGLDFDDAAGIDFTDPRAATWKGMTLARQGLMLDAVNVYSSALRYDNRFVLAHINRGLAYAALHDYKKAIVDFDSAINVTPKDSTIYFKRAIAESSGGDWPAAINSYNQAIRLNPQYALAYKNRGEAFRQIGDAAHAQSDSRRAQELAMAAENSPARNSSTAPQNSENKNATAYRP